MARPSSVDAEQGMPVELISTEFDRELCTMRVSGRRAAVKPERHDLLSSRLPSR